MQLLFQEFFKKIFKIIDNIYVIPIKIFTKLIFYGVIIAGIFWLIFFSIIKNTYMYLIIFLGIILFAETAHFIRKSREKAMEDKAAESNNPEEVPKNDYLLKKNKPKNKDILGIKKRKIR